MSRRLPTTRFNRSLWVSMARMNSRRSASLHVMSGWSRLVADALMAASGVRRSCDTACEQRRPQGIGVGQLGRLGRLGLQPAPLQGEGQLREEAAQEALVLGAELAPAHDEHGGAVADEVPPLALERIGGHVGSGGGVDDPSVVALRQDGHAVERERGAELVEEVGERVRLADQRGRRSCQHLRLGPGAQGLAGPARRRGRRGG